MDLSWMKTYGTQTEGLFLKQAALYIAAAVLSYSTPRCVLPVIDFFLQSHTSCRIID